MSLRPSLWSLRRWWVLPAAILFAAPSPAQEPTTIKVDVRVVNVLATVRDKHGAIINNLNADDFTLTDDGHPQTIKYFVRESDLPLTLGLLVDNSRSQWTIIEQERSASRTFVDQMLREQKDSAFVIQFDREVELLQDLTGSREKLRSSLDLIKASRGQDDSQSRSAPDSSDPGGQQDRHPRGQDPQDGSRRNRAMGRSSTIYDAVFLAGDELLRKQPGRKALVLLTDGVDHGSKTSLEKAIASVQRADTVVYPIYFVGEESADRNRHGWGFPGGMGGPMGGGRGPMGGPPMGGGGRQPGGGQQGPPREEPVDGKKILKRIAGETGGRLFEVTKKQSLEQIYQQIQDELRHQYSIGYTPDNLDTGGDYHKLVLAAKNKGLTVQARDGYYSPAEERAGASK